MSPVIYIMLLYMLFFIAFKQRGTNAVFAHRAAAKRNNRRKIIVTDMLQRFLGRECLIYTINSQLSGTIKEIGGGAVVLNNGRYDEVVNIDYIIRVQEYPKNKNGKKKAVVLG